MNLEIITPESNIFKGKVDLVQVPGIKGAFTILKNHAPLISTLQKGKIRFVISDNNSTEFIDVLGGIIEVKRNNIIILADVHE